MVQQRVRVSRPHFSKGKQGCTEKLWGAMGSRAELPGLPQGSPARAGLMPWEGAAARTALLDPPSQRVSPGLFLSRFHFVTGISVLDFIPHQEERCQRGQSSPFGAQHPRQVGRVMVGR